ncbi:hypothetical protein B5X24_HaOG214178 [Helicoverpa armigera]|nr:hypothetical protein B5X24_HaOG214178 [Helicoverpa armigera]
MQQAWLLSRLRRFVAPARAVPCELIVADGFHAHHRSFGLVAGRTSQPQPRRRALKLPAPQLAGRLAPPRLRGFELHSRV